MPILKGKTDLATAIAAHPLVKEARAAFDNEEEWPDVAKHIQRELVRIPVHPAWGSEWGPFLDANLEEAIEEAIEIVM